jgi:hypothetical protein
MLLSYRHCNTGQREREPVHWLAHNYNHADHQQETMHEFHSGILSVMAPAYATA